MIRRNLTKARNKANLTQLALAESIGTTRSTVSRWERGKHPISAYFREKLQEKLNYTDEHLAVSDGQELDDTRKEEDSQPSQVDVKMGSSDSYTDIQESEEEDPMNRRTFTQTLGVSGLTLVSNVSIVSGPIIAPERHYQTATGVIRLAWDMFNRGQYSDVQILLNIHMLTLDQLATTIWDRQHDSARLAVQAEIMQALIANSYRDFSSRENHCLEAIRFAGLSDNPNILAIARFWYGDTFTYYNQPQRTVDIFNDALSEMNSESSLLARTTLLSHLSIAHAQMGDETNALDYVKQARLTIPEHPELDPLWGNYVRVGSSELDQCEGKTYLYLAEHTSSPQYARMAYERFDASTSKQSASVGYRVQALTRKADAARAMGDMRSFVKSLEQALPLIVGKRRIVEAIDVAQRIPEQWQQERAVKRLQKDLNYALVVVQ